MRAAPSYARILLALFCLLALATSASATNAWILWEEKGTMLALGGQTAFNSDWRIYKAYADQEKCETELLMLKLASHAAKENETLANGTKITSGPLREGLVGYFHTVIVDKQNATFETHTFSCLPDTVDPRGPKGK